MYKYQMVFVAAFALMTLSGAGAFADVIIDPTALTSVDWMPIGVGQNGFQWGGFPATDAINGTGLGNVGIYPTGTSVPGAWAQTTLSNGWFGNPSALFLPTPDHTGLPVTVMFDLGDSYNLSGMHIWNFTQNLDRGIDNVTVLVAPNVGGGPGAFTAVSGPNGDGSYTVAESTGASDTGNTYSLAASDVRYVEFTINSNWGSYAAEGAAYTGLNQVRFLGSTVPEPSTLALLGGGLLGLLAYAWRKRR